MTIDEIRESDEFREFMKKVGPFQIRNSAYFEDESEDKWTRMDIPNQEQRETEYHRMKNRGCDYD